MRIHISIPHRKKHHPRQPPYHPIPVVAIKLRDFRVPFFLESLRLITLVRYAGGKTDFDTENEQRFDRFAVIKLSPSRKSERTEHRTRGTSPFNDDGIRLCTPSRKHATPKQREEQSFAKLTHGTKATHSTSTKASLGSATT